MAHEWWKLNDRIVKLESSTGFPLHLREKLDSLRDLATQCLKQL